jgi:uncharacterized protein (DUF58 family)
MSVSEGFVAVLARLLTRHGNRVGALFYGDEVEGFIPARSGRRQVLHILHRMIAPEPKSEEQRGRETDLGELLDAGGRFIRRRSLVFIVSDFISAAGWEKPLALLARRHEVVAVRVHDALEAELPDLGLVVMQDAETGEQLFVDTHDGAFRKRFREAASRREANLRQSLSAAGVDALELATGEDLAESILRFATLRKRRGQGVRKAA